LRFLFGEFAKQILFRADKFGSGAAAGGRLCPAVALAKEGLTFAKFGSNFFVNLDQKRSVRFAVGGAPCAASRTERRKALFIFCRSCRIQKKERKRKNYVFLKRKTLATASLKNF
jgi:hypothetical protein